MSNSNGLWGAELMHNRLLFLSYSWYQSRGVSYNTCGTWYSLEPSLHGQPFFSMCGWIIHTPEMVLMNIFGLNFLFLAKCRCLGIDLCLGDMKNSPLVRVHTNGVDFQQRTD